MTGGLLGRYVAEERDSGRKFADCYAILCADADKAGAKSNGAKGKARQGEGQEEVVVAAVEPEGDPACWLDRVCDVCGRFVEAGEPHECRLATTRPRDGG